MRARRRWLNLTGQIGEEVDQGPLTKVQRSSRTPDTRIRGPLQAHASRAMFPVKEDPFSKYIETLEDLKHDLPLVLGVLHI